MTQPTGNKSFSERIDDLDLPRRFNELADVATKTFHSARGVAGDLAHENRDKVDGLLAKAESAIDQRTDGKYHDTVAKVRSGLATGVDKLAAQRPGAPGTEHAAGDSADSPRPADPSGPSAGGFPTTP